MAGGAAAGAGNATEGKKELVIQEVGAGGMLAGCIVCLKYVP